MRTALSAHWVWPWRARVALADRVTSSGRSRSRQSRKSSRGGAVRDGGVSEDLAEQRPVRHQGGLARADGVEGRSGHQHAGPEREDERVERDQALVVDVLRLVAGAKGADAGVVRYGLVAQAHHEELQVGTRAGVKRVEHELHVLLDARRPDDPQSDGTGLEPQLRLDEGARSTGVGGEAVTPVAVGDHPVDRILAVGVASQGLLAPPLGVVDDRGGGLGPESVDLVGLRPPRRVREQVVLGPEDAGPTRRQALQRPPVVGGVVSLPPLGPVHVQDVGLGKPPGLLEQVGMGQARHDAITQGVVQRCVVVVPVSAARDPQRRRDPPADAQPRSGLDVELLDRGDLGPEAPVLGQPLHVDAVHPVGRLGLERNADGP